MKPFKVLFFSSLLILSACQNRPLQSSPPAHEPTPQTSPDAPAPVDNNTVKTPSPQETNRLGIILGPGGAKTLAQIGFLKELQARKIPVQAIVGLEWGSLIAASFAAKGSAHESEWQLSKLKDPASNWLGNNRSGNNVKTFIEPLSAYLSSYAAEDSKVPFACPSFNVRKNQMFMMAKGRLNQMLPYCLAYPPHFAVFEGTVAAPREVQLAVDHLRRQGANYIILVNVLGGLNPEEALPWQELQYDMKRKWPGVQERLDIVIRNQSISDFKSRQELIQLGSEQSVPFVEKLMNRF